MLPKAAAFPTCHAPDTIEAAVVQTQTGTVAPIFSACVCSRNPAEVQDSASRAPTGMVSHDSSLDRRKPVLRGSRVAV